MKRTYTGSCHCGAVRFEADLDLSQGSSRCNCSICAKLRYWFAFVPDEEFHLLQGANALTDYQIKPGSIYHRFCSRCGVKPFGRGIVDELDADVAGDFYAVNVACLDNATDEELAEAPVDYLDGRNDDWESEPTETRHL
ncbi:GFA family protein [Natrinema gelatinilyticum]|uniref:GFA family protein n=1 Tax=Natrinema gelatinilyticum TaxID=2961571 RepID=UPI0020C4B070|nr:GFA family protein [Natrinema gelatinilyticum]